MNRIAEINRKAWNKIILEGRKIHASESPKEDFLLNLFIKSLPAKGKVLDLGCGNGIPIGKMLSDSGLKVVGVDVSDEMVKAYKNNVYGAKVFRMPITDINFNDEFNGIVSSYSLLCLPPKDFSVASEKIVKALKKNGSFLLFLNEGDVKDGGIEKVQGHPMYTSGISESDVRDYFEGKGMIVDIVEREVGKTEEYGEEHAMMFLMHKNSNLST